MVTFNIIVDVVLISLLAVSIYLDRKTRKERKELLEELEKFNNQPNQ